jgi:hypothetical protein
VTELGTLDDSRTATEVSLATIMYEVDDNEVTSAAGTATTDDVSQFDGTATTVGVGTGTTTEAGRTETGTDWVNYSVWVGLTIKVDLTVVVNPGDPGAL